jgi:hypothetical protein
LLGTIIQRLTTSPAVRLAACAFLVLDSHALYNVLTQSDVGLFLAVSSGLFAALLADRWGWFAVLLLVSPWSRPEGAFLSFLFAGALLFRRFLFRQRASAWQWVLAVAAIVSSLGVFAFNKWLTGVWQFQSVFYKSYFKQKDFLDAVNQTTIDLLTMVKDLLLGLPHSMPREVYFLPVFGAAFAWLGLAVRKWDRGDAWKELWWLVACAATVGVVASSGWQNTNTDRYLAWLFPIWFIYMAEGVVWAARHCPPGGCRFLPFAMVVCFQLVSGIWLLSALYTVSLSHQQQYDFQKEVCGVIPKTATLGSDDPSIAYAFQGHRLVHLEGLYSPDLLYGVPAIVKLEQVKNRPELRFDYWWLQNRSAGFAGANIDALCGPAIALGMDRSALCKARWDAFDLARLPASKEARAATAGWRLVDQLDVGCPEDEQRCGYSTFSRFYRTVYSPFGVTGIVGTNTLFEVGRLVVGSESFTLRAFPSRPLKIVLRTVANAETQVQTANSAAVSRNIALSSPLVLRIHVDGQEAGLVKLPLDTRATAFSELVITLNAEMIKKASPRLTLYGDHVALAYWFYQPEPND